jgi:pimeloyl-ACP methyl ester carboxylesterase
MRNDDAANLRADLEAVVAELDLDRAVLVVHDASGWPGIDWSLANPERAVALVALEHCLPSCADPLAAGGAGPVRGVGPGTRRAGRARARG